LLCAAIVLAALVVAGCQPQATPTLPAATIVYGPVLPPATAVQSVVPADTPTPEAPTLTPTDAPPTATQGAPEGDSGETYTLTILHTNDVSGWTEPCG
jgi:2',3'-cyclic-nucleotide 2'-phosphodiesterase (5'-nucleotidase family)